MRKIYKEGNQNNKHKVIRVVGVCADATAIAMACFIGTYVLCDLVNSSIKNDFNIAFSNDNYSSDDIYSEEKISNIKDQTITEYKTLIRMVNSNIETIKGNDKLALMIEAEYEDYTNSISNSFIDNSDGGRINLATSYYVVEINILNQELNQYKLQLQSNLITSDTYYTNEKIINNQIKDYQIIVDDLGKEYIELYSNIKVLN